MAYSTLVGARVKVDEGDGHQAVASLFGGSGTDQVAAALAAGGAGNSDLLKQLLPIVLPVVLAYVGRQLGSGGAEQCAQNGGRRRWRAG